MTASTSSAAPTALDGEIEQAVGDLAALHHDHQAGLLTPERAALAAAHRDLGLAETAVAYHLNVLMKLSAGTHPVDAALLDRMRRALTNLAHAAAERDENQDRAASALGAVRAASPVAVPAHTELTPHDLAALLSLASGGTVREHLHTHRLSVRTTHGRIVDYAAYQRLEHQGLVARDTSRSLIAGQPVTLTHTGRTALLGSRRPAASQAPAPTRPVGAWPAPARSR
ncbi:MULTISPECIES: hypothetical protein [Streptomyces]|uniref:Uncharacterized protein n=2 Tax=Streptomyces TaxID=1883 RepID=A0A100Y6E0_9ACTN|nr:MULTISPECIES: hypothetical protein [Streptomyces]KUH38559.1 hypothetical protein ATE80_11810 [Streptomyces kanasensis]UUS33958.1 hypothetical protein NRO40_26140 [Streptomyces changanensis]